MTLLSILTVLSNAVIWIVSSHPPTSKSSRPFNNPLVIGPKAPLWIGTIVAFMFHSFFNSLARSRYLSFFSHSFRFIVDSYYYYYYYYFTTLRDFHTSFSWLPFTAVWVTASLLKSPVLFSVFWSILQMLSSGCYLLVLLFPSLPVPFQFFWGLF